MQLGYVEATGQQLQLDNLPMVWQAIDKALKQANDSYERSQSSLNLTARGFDEAQDTGRRVYFEATRFLNVALDNHRALVKLLPNAGATVWAPWSLLRPIFETAFFAGWILDPDDGRQRRIRALRCEVRDSREQLAHLNSFAQVPEVARAVADHLRNVELGSMALYKAHAAQLGESWDHIHSRRIVISDQVKRLSYVKDGDMAPFMESSWRMLSGFEHGLGWAAMRGSHLETIADVPGGQHVQFTIDDEAFTTAAKATYFLLFSAIELLTKRQTQP